MKRKVSDVFYVTLSVYPHRTGWKVKVSLTTVRIKPTTFGILSPMLCQLSYEAKSVRVCGISELSLVPSISICSIIIIFCVCVLMLCTQVNIMFLVLL